MFNPKAKRPVRPQRPRPFTRAPAYFSSPAPSTPSSPATTSAASPTQFTTTQPTSSQLNPIPETFCPCSPDILPPSSSSANTSSPVNPSSAIPPPDDNRFDILPHEFSSSPAQSKPYKNPAALYNWSTNEQSRWVDINHIHDFLQTVDDETFSD